MHTFLAKQVELNTNALKNTASKISPFVYGETDGTNTAYTVAIANAPDLSNGLMVLLKVHVTNSYNATFKYNNSQEYPIYYTDVPAEPNMLRKNNYAILRYKSGTNIWEIVNTGGGGGSGGGSSYYAETTGATDYLVEIPSGPIPYSGLNIILKVHRDSILGQKLNYNEYGPIPLKIKNSELASRKIKAGSIIIIVYRDNAWEIVLGGNELYAIGDLGLTDLTYLLIDAKYYIRKDVSEGATNIGFIGGEIESFDPDHEELRFLIDGVEQVPTEDYEINTNNRSVDLLNKTGIFGKVYTFITRLTITAATTKNVIVQMNLLKNEWVADVINGGFVYRFAVSNLLESDNCIFAIAGDSTESESFQYSSKKVRCIAINTNEAVIHCKAIPTTDIRCVLMIIR